jgi:serine/threonine-protein kinase HipA
MINLSVYIEINGTEKHVGNISGNNSDDACFEYSKDYLADIKSKAISISLPLSEIRFDPVKTRNFFEGLLPEGFTKHFVAQWLHEDENDYLSLLHNLGRECLGAVRIIAENDDIPSSSYKKLTFSEVKKLAKEGASESASLVTKAHLSLTGASGKAGLYFDEKNNDWFLPLGSAPSTHIVKQSHIRLKQIVTNEHLCLLAAKRAGISIPESFILNTGSGADEDILFATKRFDRIISADNRNLNGLIVPNRLHQEDFAQALGISAADKYEKDNGGYLKKCFDLIKNYSSSPIEDQLKLWNICIFNYLIGNTDNHIKNISLLYSKDMKSIRLAPAYDIVSTIIYENSSENMALSIDGKYNIYDITRDSFKNEAVNIGIGVNVAMKHFDTMFERFENALESAKNELSASAFDNSEGIYEKILSQWRARKKYIL